MTPPVAMTIAGSDSSGGAGIQADLRTFGALGVFGTSIVTAVTAQSTVGVTDVAVIPRDTVDAQLRTVLDDLPVAAVKTGMLATADLVGLVADYAASGALPNLVVDPVLVSATGHRLLEEDAVALYRERLLPRALVATPNLIEAGVLVGRRLGDLDDARAAGRELVADGARIVVVKGGHGAGAQAVDVVVGDGIDGELTAERLGGDNTHGSGCTFAAACAAGLASGLEPADALDQAKRYVTAAIAGAQAWRLGSGHGPLDHLGFTKTDPA